VSAPKDFPFCPTLGRTVARYERNEDDPTRERYVGTDYEHEGGITARDFFAATALQGYLACQDFTNEVAAQCESRDECRKELARLAYAQADAMIAARSSEGGAL
jgi:hypothetical protein